MSTDRANDKQVDQDGTLAETAAAAETEISDETLEAVAGGKSLEAYNATPLERSNAIPTDPVRISLSSPTH